MLGLQPVTFDLSSIIVTVAVGALVFLGKRAITNIDNNFLDVKKQISEGKDETKQQISAGRKESEDQIGVIHRRLDSHKQELSEEIKDVRLDVKDAKSDVKEGTLELLKLKDKTTDMITAVRMDLEGKLETYDERIRDLEKK